LCTCFVEGDVPGSVWSAIVVDSSNSPVVQVELDIRKKALETRLDGVLISFENEGEQILNGI